MDRAPAMPFAPLGFTRILQPVAFGKGDMVSPARKERPACGSRSGDYQMKKLIAAIAASAALGSVAGAAQDIVSNPRGMVPNFDVQNVGPVLSELGAVWQEGVASNGQHYIQASVGDGLYLNFLPMACDGDTGKNCVGLSTVAFFTSDAINYQTIAAFNQRYRFAAAGISPDNKSAYITRYDLADYGIPRGNLASSVANLAYLASIFRNEIASAGKTVSFEGYSDDMSSRLLNTRGVEAIGGSVEAATRHQEAFEQSAELIQILMQDRDAPRNKIENLGAKH